MMDQDKLKKWIETNCPVLWSLLNQRARRYLPTGLIEYISGGTIILNPIEDVLKDLESMCGSKSLEDNYRRDFSGVNSGTQVWDLFEEIALCSSLGKISDRIILRPPTGKGTYSDCLFSLKGFDIFAEVKRYPDPWPPIYRLGSARHEKKPNIRSISKSPLDEKPHDTARPRSMDLRSKLRDVHRQFPERSINILFIFHQSFGDSKRYLAQSFLGDSNFFENGAYKLKEDGLFYDEEWRNISACCLSRLNSDSQVIFPFVWENPRAFMKLPKQVLESLKL
ncbi:MAG: hypothetical protein Q7O12_13140 [Deltaproteobacteria bacterium]|nr:hypothetical protein [Deltaproteobacteria bacterium]